MKAKPATSMAASHSEVAVQADLIEERRQALALSAAGRLGSSAEQSSSGSGKIGTRQEPLDGSTTEQVSGSLVC